MVPGLYGIFTTSDGWIAVVGVVGSSRDVFFGLIGRPEIVDEFPQLLYSEADKAAVFPRIDQALATRTTAEWCAAFSEAGIRHAPVRDYEAVVTDPGVWENGYLVRGGGEGGDGVLVASPVRFSETPARTGERAPELGEHTEEVLLELGFSWEDITRLSDEKAI
jgi:crotonobetainyl-CoA:carnitine CoA-transferase CaiB-like acyl-CoA transferase